VTKATGIITTYAGSAQYGSSGDGGAATSASLYYPFGVALDSAGNLFIADVGNENIRLVTKATGIITTYAGTGYTDATGYGFYSGDGGPATSATLRTPYSVAVDSADNLIIVDTGNNRIRLVTKATGIITTYAGDGYGDPIYGSGRFTGDGGAATSASLYYPTAVAVGSAGKLFIADYYNYKIRLVTPPYNPSSSPTSSPTSSPSLSPTMSPTPSKPTRAPSVAAVPTAAYAPSPPTGSGKVHPPTSSSGHKAGGSSSHHHPGGTTAGKSVRSRHHQAGGSGSGSHVTVDVGVDVGVTVKK
jgi:hypothetical protein